MAKFEPLQFGPENEGQQKLGLHSYLREDLVLHAMIQWGQSEQGSSSSETDVRLTEPESPEVRLSDS